MKIFLEQQLRRIIRPVSTELNVTIDRFYKTSGDLSLRRNEPFTMLEYSDCTHSSGGLAVRGTEAKAINAVMFSAYPLR